jgi:20S proteasome subunit beta 4
METLIGIACEDHVILAGAAFANMSILQLKNDEDKLHKIDTRMVLGATGEQGDRVNLAEYIARNLALNETRSHRPNTGPTTAHYIRRVLADSLRSRSMYQVNALLGTFDIAGSDLGPHLYFLDYLGTMHQVPYATQGFAGSFCMAVLDRYYKRNQTVEESVHLLKRCVAEVRDRVVINNCQFFVKVIDAKGVRMLDPINAATPFEKEAPAGLPPVQETVPMEH